MRPPRDSSRAHRAPRRRAASCRRGSPIVQARPRISTISGVGTGRRRRDSTTIPRSRTRTSGMSIITGQTSAQAPHSVDA
ncbi:hypothetical protein [Actinomadura madurae]|uniref:hypothetical protein n=1 Tax=Actinomadura madurae TaxID=1993 RepID=UPI00355934F5